MSALDTVGKVFKKVFGSRNERIVRRYRQIAHEIEDLEPELRGDYDKVFEQRLAALPLDDLEGPQRQAAIHNLRKELSQALADRTSQLKWRLREPEPLTGIAPPEYTHSAVQRWERALAEGHDLADLLSDDLRPQATTIRQRLESGQPLDDIITDDHLEAPVFQWQHRLDAGEDLDAVLPPELRDRLDEFRLRMAPPESVDDHLPEAFALVREASRRAQAHRHFECQLVGGQVLYNGSVAEMKTGEGKTIVCHLAAMLKVLQGEKVHIVTVNDYLVKRDAEFGQPIFDLLGITVGYIQSGIDPGGYEGIRKTQYACDITYGTNNEFGFDYLRDNMKMRAADQCQGPLDYTIVDEVDSILIDEARTPLIISGPARGNPSDYKAADDYAVALVDEQKKANNDTRKRLAELEQQGQFPEAMQRNPKFEDALKRFRIDPYMLIEEEAEAIGHRQYFVVQRDRKQAHLTHEGTEVAGKVSGLGSFYLEENMHWPHLIENALRARVVYERDKEYVVQNREVIIVDEFTGRLMHGRQWSDGLHQAVEAKHRNEAEIKRETQTLATVTLQNFFKLYDALAGMTGTAMTESDEFMKIYRLEVVDIPTNRPVNRNEHNDKIYRTVEGKYTAITDEIHHMHRRGRPTDPFLLADVFRQLEPIMQTHAPDRVPEIQDALRQFADTEAEEAKVLDTMLGVYDQAMADLATGRPVLVGTTSVENSEMLQKQLMRRHPEDFPTQPASKEIVGLEVLNAKFHEREAEIVAKAGQRYDAMGGKARFGNVTIATNMAGRGTDIKLEPGVVYEKCKGSLAYDDGQTGTRSPLFWQERNPDGSAKVGTKCCIHCPDYDGKCEHCWKPKLDPRFPELGRKVCSLNSPCGLHIVGTERHESRRIDNQLRGRSGRQGDPGSSRFFLSLEDDLLKLFMPDWMIKWMDKLGFAEGGNIEAKQVTKGIERAQRKVEERNFASRKHLLEWDEPIDYQRKAFYRERQSVLVGRSQEPLIRRMIDESIDDAAVRFLAEDYPAQCIANYCSETFKLDLGASLFAGMGAEDVDEIKSIIRDRVLDKARDDVSNVIGEYIDPDLPPNEWDVRGLSRWAGQLGAALSENQLRKMDPPQIEAALLEAAEQFAENVDIDGVEAYLTPNRGLDDLLFWASRRFDFSVDDRQITASDAGAIREAVRQRIHSLYDERRAEFPVEWVMQEAYLRRAESGVQEGRWGHEFVARWARAKFAVPFTAETLQEQFGGDFDRIQKALLDMQHKSLNGNGQSPLRRQIDAAIQRTTGKPGILRSWARDRFQRAFDAEEFDAAISNGDNLAETLEEMGRQWLTWEFGRFENALLLRCYDEAWMDHLLEMDHLKYAIMQRPLGGDQTHPQSQYAIEGREYFDKMWGRVREAILGRIMRVRPSGEFAARSIYQAAETRHEEATGSGFRGAAGESPQDAAMRAQGEQHITQTIRRQRPKIKPNEPCPCGSGKKYKKCHGRPGAPPLPEATLTKR